MIQALLRASNQTHRGQRNGYAPWFLRAVIYARDSTDLQSAVSVKDQVRMCKERMCREGWELVQVFQDRALSGSANLRPGYQALVAGARDGAFE